MRKLTFDVRGFIYYIHSMDFLKISYDSEQTDIFTKEDAAALWVEFKDVSAVSDRILQLRGDTQLMRLRGVTNIEVDEDEEALISFITVRCERQREDGETLTTTFKLAAWG